MNSGILRDRFERLSVSVIVVLYAAGVFGHLYIPARGMMERITPWFLASSGLAVLWLSLPFREIRSWVWVVSVFLFCFIVEALGVATGAIFGGYHYSAKLGSLLLGVPPVIALNWVLVVSAGLKIFERLPTVARVIATGIICILFDLVLEQAVLALGYWEWTGGQIPFQNYIAWGFVAALCALLAHALQICISRWTVVALAGAQLCFFTALWVWG